MFSNIAHYYIVFVNGPDKATCVACDKAVEIGVVIDFARDKLGLSPSIAVPIKLEGSEGHKQAVEVLKAFGARFHTIHKMLVH